MILRGQCLVVTLFLLIGSCQTGQKDYLDSPEENFSIHYEVFGTGPAMLLINGGPGYSSEGFRSVARQLSDTLAHQVIIYDQRGTGQSPLDTISEETVTLNLMVNDMEELRHHLKVKKWVVMGHSFGGILAASYATKYPDRISKLILSSSGGMDLTTLSSEGTLARLTDVQLDSMIYWSNKMASGDTSWATQYQWALNLAPAFVYNKEYIPSIATRLTQGNREISGLVIRNMQDIHFDLKESLRDFQNPVLIIQGEYDIIKKTTAQQTHGIFSHSKLVILDSSGHYGWLDRPSEYFDEIKSFILQ